MSKTTKRRPKDEMQAEYDFSRGVRGKYAARFARGTNVVVLDPDVARVFADPRVVNDLLRYLANLPSKLRGRRSAE